MWLAESVLETGESAPRIQFEDVRARIAQMQITLNQSIDAALVQLKRYRQSRPAQHAIQHNVSSKNCEGMLAMQAALVMDSVERFRKLKLAGLFRGPILIVPTFIIVGI